MLARYVNMIDILCQLGYRTNLREERGQCTIILSTWYIKQEARAADSAMPSILIGNIEDTDTCSRTDLRVKLCMMTVP